LDVKESRLDSRQGLEQSFPNVGLPDRIRNPPSRLIADSLGCLYGDKVAAA
jgi:hypothetical protein